MSDEYLWDRSGEPDPEIERLERVLSRYGCPKEKPRRPYRALAAAAGIAIVGIRVAYWLRLPGKPSEWTLAAGRSVRIGETIATGANESLRLTADAVGLVDLQSNSRMKLLRSGGTQQRMALERGAMHAFIWAPPTQFVVDTPSATTIDLGCEYELRVMEDGSGLLTVWRGWVAFQAGDRESFIPADAQCRTRKRSGPGLPYFTDASPAFRDAVAAVENGGSPGPLPAEARPRDALTLWHLLRRTPAAGRALIAQRFGELVPGVSIDGLRSGDAASLEAAWNALSLGDTTWWRSWKQKW